MPIFGYANPIGVSSDASDTSQKPAPVDYIHYVQAQKITPAQPHVVLNNDNKNCKLATDFISSTGGSARTTCPDGFLPYQIIADGSALFNVSDRTYQLYCCKGDVIYS